MSLCECKRLIKNFVDYFRSGNGTKSMIKVSKQSTCERTARTMDSRHWVNGIVVVRSVIVLVAVVVVWHLVCKQRSSTTLIKKTAAGAQEQQLPLLLSPIEPVSAFRRLPQHVHNESCWLCANNFSAPPPPLLLASQTHLPCPVQGNSFWLLLLLC